MTGAGTLPVELHFQNIQLLLRFKNMLGSWALDLSDL